MILKTYVFERKNRNIRCCVLCGRFLYIIYKNFMKNVRWDFLNFAGILFREENFLYRLLLRNYCSTMKHIAIIIQNKLSEKMFKLGIETRYLAYRVNVLTFRYLGWEPLNIFCSDNLVVITSHPSQVALKNNHQVKKFHVSILYIL